MQVEEKKNKETEVKRFNISAAGLNSSLKLSLQGICHRISFSDNSLPTLGITKDKKILNVNIILNSGSLIRSGIARVKVFLHEEKADDSGLPFLSPAPMTGGEIHDDINPGQHDHISNRMAVHRYKVNFSIGYIISCFQGSDLQIKGH